MNTNSQEQSNARGTAAQGKERKHPLVELQEKSRVLYDLRESLEGVNRDLTRAANRVLDLKEKCVAARREQTAAEVNLRRLELERASENEILSATRDQLFDGSGATTYRDTQRLQDREHELMNRIDAIDERISPLREMANEARAKLESSEADLSQAEEDWEGRKQTGSDEWKKIHEAMKVAEADREPVAKTIDKGELATFERLFNANGGQAIATVEREVCTGCSERLSAGELNDLKKTSPKLCHCGKFLIMLSTG